MGGVRRKEAWGARLWGHSIGYTPARDMSGAGRPDGPPPRARYNDEPRGSFDLNAELTGPATQAGRNIRIQIESTDAARTLAAELLGWADMREGREVTGDEPRCDSE